MSPDDIIAANLWPWPDPLLKREPGGNILFVNAAFLQLYGGRVEDWRGRTVSGWPAPTPQGAQRFETRTGDASDVSIYDWVEMVMADGNTMAIARNVTALMATPTPPKNIKVPIEPPTLQTVTSAPSALEASAIPEAVPAVHAPQPIAPKLAAAENSAPAHAPQALEDTLNNDADDYAYETIPAPQPAPQNKQPTAANLNPAPEPETPRMIERRALPIEDSATVLGTNWRDEVIAKALGVEDPAPSPAQTQPEQNAAQTTQAIAPTQPKNKLHILLAEDNAINALLTRTLLEAEGAVVETVEDGALAVTAAQNHKYDMIFMDMRMPNMDGLESTRKIRSLGHKMPIIALTANAFDDDRNSCFDSGMNDFMTKPVSAEELSAMVSSWANKTADNEKIAS